MRYTAEHFIGLDQMNRALAARIIAVAQEAVIARGRFSLVLTGGKTPAGLYRLLATEPYVSDMPWQATHLFWGDERFFPADHPDSNFYLAQSTLLRHVPVPAKNIHPISTAFASPYDAARSYQHEIASFFAQETKEKGAAINHEAGEGRGAFDCLLLGMGEDGHIASLFPSHSLLDENCLLVAAVPEAAGSPPVVRVTLTFPAIARSRKVFFVISGNRKKAIMDTILSGCSLEYPAAKVRAQGDIVWFVADQ